MPLLLLLLLLLLLAEAGALGGVGCQGSPTTPGTAAAEKSGAASLDLLNGFGSLSTRCAPAGCAAALWVAKWQVGAALWCSSSGSTGDQLAL